MEKKHFPFPLILVAIAAILPLGVISSSVCSSTFFNGVEKCSSSQLHGHVKIDGEINHEAHSGQSSMNLIFESLGKTGLVANIGMELPDVLNSPTVNENSTESNLILNWGDFAQVSVESASVATGMCSRVQWRSTAARRLEDCFEMESGVHWFGGPGPKHPESWPIEKKKRNESPMATGIENDAVLENYWLVSSGIAIHVDEDVPLFFSVNSTHPNKFCILAEDRWPFKRRRVLELKYDICSGVAGENFKDVHRRAFKRFYAPAPREMVDQDMLLRPYWSTWAEYKAEINQTTVLELVANLKAHGLGSLSHIQIDDDWETCYGHLEFNKDKFPDPAAMVADLKSQGFRVGLWTHPFINYGCPMFNYAMDQGFLVKDEDSKVGLTGWWTRGGGNAGYLDFTNPGAIEWFHERLEKIRNDYGFDTFKFDAGEAGYLPHDHQLAVDSSLQPNVFTTRYVEQVSKFGSMIEVRVAHRNQIEPIFIRFNDKSSDWGEENGLKSLIPSLLDFGLKGYPFVLPDMIGGNAYGGQPSKELYIRWTQANTFMPAMQFSLVPWNYDEETVQIVKDMIKLRELHSDAMLRAGEEAVANGSPVNRPMWWFDPEDKNTVTIDDQFMLGDTVLVAPVVEDGARARDIYLPVGNWVYQNGSIYTGPTTLKQFPAPLQTLPFFVLAP